jgi:hypothetical protein
MFSGPDAEVQQDPVSSVVINIMFVMRLCGDKSRVGD